jgi:hypothetical protein
MKIFECLDAEKPTPIFVNLAQCRNTSKHLTGIMKCGIGENNGKK